MRVYFASLSDYNAGHLIGVWVDLEGLDETEIQDEINAMLRTSKYPNVAYTCSECDGRGSYLVASCVSDERAPCPHCDGKGEYASAEEWSIHDYDDFPNMGENPSLSDVAEMAERISDHGEAWLAYVENVGTHYATEDDFNDKQAGSADSELEWVENFVDEMGVLSEMPENLRNYFDYEAYLRDMKMGGEVSFVRMDGTVYAFWG